MKCKRQNHKSCKTHFRETSTLKNVKIASASFRDCSPVQVFDSYVQILHSEYDNIKNRNSVEIGSLMHFIPRLCLGSSWTFPRFLPSSKIKSQYVHELLAAAPSYVKLAPPVRLCETNPWPTTCNKSPKQSFHLIFLQPCNKSPHRFEVTPKNQRNDKEKHVDSSTFKYLMCFIIIYI